MEREQDLRRHLHDLVTRTFEGADNWTDRVALFDRGVELLDPLVRAVLAELDETFLDRTGTIAGRRADDVEGGVVQRWELSWPRQRTAVARGGGPVAPVQVIAHFRRSFNHPHLRASIGGDWPMQVLDADDAKRQEPTVRAIVETEFHQRIFEGFWAIVPAMVREHGEP